MFMTFKLFIFGALVLIPLQTNGQKRTTNDSRDVKVFQRQLDSLKQEKENSGESSSIRIDSLELLVKELIKLERSQSERIKDMVNSANAPDFFWKKDFLYPFILSIISAYIFWLAFSYFPEYTRRIKLRPKLELDVYHVYSDLFDVFDTIMRHSQYSPSLFQGEIRGGKLTKDQLSTGLQNKCLNESYLYDNKVSALLMPIGKTLKSSAQKIDETIEKIFSFSSLLSASEILLLERIRKTLQVYPYDLTAVSVIGDRTFYPVNPSMASRAENYFNLYQLFVELSDVLVKYRYRDRSVTLHIIQKLYTSEKFTQCLKEISKSLPKYHSDKNFLEAYYILAQYKRGNTAAALSKLITLLSQKPDLITIRSFLMDLIEDPQIDAILKRQYPQFQIDGLKSAIDAEKKLKKDFEANGVKLKKYYEDLSKTRAKQRDEKRREEGKPPIA